MDGPSGELCLTSGHRVDCRPRWHGGRLEAAGRSCMLTSPSPDLESPSPGLGRVSVGLHRSFCGLLYQRLSHVCEMRFLVDGL